MSKCGDCGATDGHSYWCQHAKGKREMDVVNFCKACALDNNCPDHPYKPPPRRTLTKPLRGVDRAVHNSPPPLDDVGEDVYAMLDEKDPHLDPPHHVHIDPHTGEQINPHVVAANFDEEQHLKKIAWDTAREVEKLEAMNPKDLMAATKAPLGLLPTVARVWGAVALYCGNFLSPRKDGRTGYCPYNWRRSKVFATNYIDAIERHTLALRDGEWFDPASPGGAVPHLGFIIAGAAILLDAKAYGTMVDDRYKGPGAAALKEAAEFVKANPIPEDFIMNGAGERYCD